MKILIISGVVLITVGAVVLAAGILMTRATAPQTASMEPVSSLQMSESECLNEIESICLGRQLKWKIFCMKYEGKPIDSNTTWTAYAEPFESKGTYIEDGALPYWLAYGQTREAAAYMLLDRLQGPVNRQPKHREPPTVHECTELSGGYIGSSISASTGAR